MTLLVPDGHSQFTYSIWEAYSSSQGKASLAAQAKKRKVTLAEPTADVRFDEMYHWPETTDRQRCRQCSHRKHFTYFKCTKCNIPLCLTRERNYFLEYHQSPT